MPLLFMILIVWDIRTKKMKERTKTSSLITDHFTLTFVNLFITFFTGFELMYHDSGNLIHFSIFRMQIFPLSQKILIPKYNAVSYS